MANSNAFTLTNDDTMQMQKFAILFQYVSEVMQDMHMVAVEH